MAQYLAVQPQFQTVKPVFLRWLNHVKSPHFRWINRHFGWEKTRPWSCLVGRHIQPQAQGLNESHDHKGWRGDSENPQWLLGFMVGLTMKNADFTNKHAGIMTCCFNDMPHVIYRHILGCFLFFWPKQPQDIPNNGHGGSTFHQKPRVASKQQTGDMVPERCY